LDIRGGKPLVAFHGLPLVESRLDFYTKDVGKIPASWILKTSVPVQVGKRSIRVICLEGLILAKHRAGRTTDVDDLNHLFAQCGPSIKWEVMKKVADPVEIAELQKVSAALSS
jgi:predicted nucleotidyltransferase